MLRSLEDILAAARAQAAQKVIAVAVAEDAAVMEAVKGAYEQDLATAILVGNAAHIAGAAAEVGFDLAPAQVIDEPDSVLAARTAVRLVQQGQAQILMKGLVGTAVLLRAVLDKEIGLRAGRILSHVAIMEPEGLGRLLLMTDGGMNIAPDLQQKAQLINNAVEVAHHLGNDCPKVAALAAFEQVNPSMPATVDAALLAKMAERGQIKHCIVDGPIALDGAISPAAAVHKGMQSPIAGQADILLVPAIEVGNVLYKTLVYLGRGKVAGVIAGAAAPIVLTSRSDTPQAKLYSLAAAVLMSG